MTDTASKDSTKPFTLPSGATLHVGRPRFADAGRLRDALVRAATTKPLSGDEMKAGWAEVKKDPSLGGALLQRVLSVAASEEVEAAVFACLQAAAYQPKDTEARIKVTRDLFDDPNFGDAARQDYYPICYRAAEVAVLPFLGALVSMYTEYLKRIGRAPDSPPTSPPKGS